MSRGTTAVININNLKHNFQVLRELAPGKLVLVVKADAYGHGLKQVVKALDNADCFAVATIEEALTIRKYRPKVKVLLLEGYLDKAELKIAFDQKFDCVIHQQEQIQLLDEIQTSQTMNVWLKLDSGMNRLGFLADKYTQAIVDLENNNKVNELILMSHFASANQKHNIFNTQQVERFLEYKTNHQISISNSSALLNQINLTDEWCRVGLALFGISPIEGKTAKDFNLKPVMTLKTNIIAIKQVSRGETIGYGQTYTAQTNMRVAIIGIGYGDGYPWSISNQACVKVNQQFAAIVGRVSMDMMAIDISELNNLEIGNSVIIWGEDNQSELPLEIVASHANTIGYVLLCQITSRVHYQYV